MAGRTKSLYESLENGSVDIVLDSQNTAVNFERLKLWEEKYVFLIRRDHPGIDGLLDKVLTLEELYSGSFPKKKEVRSFHSLGKINIFMPGRNLRMRDVMKNHFKDIMSRQISLKSFYRLDLQYSMAENGLGALICPQSLVISKGYDERKLSCFSINFPDNKREVFLYYNRNNTSEYLENFIRTAAKMYEKQHFFPDNTDTVTFTAD